MLQSMGSLRVGHDLVTEHTQACLKPLSNTVTMSVKPFSVHHIRGFVVQSLSHVQLFAKPWTAACQAPLSFTISWSLFKLMFIKLWCHPIMSFSFIPFSSHLQAFSGSGSFQMSQLFTSGGRSIGASASESVLPMNIQDWFPLGWTDLISLWSKGL